MPADLNNPFGESCCDGGGCAVTHESARPCGCDYGANHLCEQHSLTQIKSEVHWLLKRINTQSIDISELEIACEIMSKLDRWSQDE